MSLANITFKRLGGGRGGGDENGNRKKICVSLNPNPSHLESINPVVMGKVGAKRAFLNDTSREKVLGVLLHGDASFSGQVRGSPRAAHKPVKVHARKISFS